MTFKPEQYLRVFSIAKSSSFFVKPVLVPWSCVSWSQCQLLTTDPAVMNRDATSHAASRETSEDKETPPVATATSSHQQISHQLTQTHHV